jgi:hypothetical protein
MKPRTERVRWKKPQLPAGLPRRDYRISCDFSLDGSCPEYGKAKLVVIDEVVYKKKAVQRTGECP